MVKETMVGVLEIVVHGKRDFANLVAKGNSKLVGLTIVPKVRDIEMFWGSTSED
jgi:hypothetical protein